MLDNILKFLRRNPRLGRIALQCVPDLPINIQIDGIGSFRIRLRRNRAFWLRNPLRHERYPLAALDHFTTLSGDCTMYDVGANIGLYTRFALQQFGVERVVAFEPMQANFSHLQENIRLSGLKDRVDTHPCAITDKNETVKLQIDDIQSATAALDHVTDGAAAEGRKNLNLEPKTEEVEARTLDSLLSSDITPPPDIVKIDIEGGEILAVRGMKGTIATHSPHLVIELHGAKVGREILSILFSMDYSVAGNVHGNLREGEEWHRQLREEDISRIEGKYDLQFIMASPESSHLPTDLAPYYTSGS